MEQCRENFHLEQVEPEKKKKASETGFPLKFWSITLKYKLSSITIVIPHMFTWTSVLFLPTDLSL